jgi:hypothetical protein
MSQEHDGPVTGTTGEAMDLHRRAIFGGSTWTYPDVTEDHGTIRETEQGSGDVVSILPPAMGRTVIMVADGVIAAGANVYPATDGKVSATVQGRRIGINVGSATTTDGDWVEVLRLPEDADDLQTTGVNVLTGATMAITAAMCKNGVVSTDHSTTATVNLPAGKKGMKVKIIKVDSNAAAHTITPNGSEKIQGASTLATVDAQFDSVSLEYTGSSVVGWLITGKSIA